jgi:nucleotide-binding universal stress UspA family protein
MHKEGVMHPRKVLLPFDGSPASRRALEYVATIEQGHDSHVHLLNVQGPTIDDSVYLGPLLKEGEQVLRVASRHLEAKAISHTCQVAVGFPSETIVLHARDERCTAIVMGVRSAIARLFSGSVSSQVVRLAGIPVTLVKATGEAIVRTPIRNQHDSV